MSEIKQLSSTVANQIAAGEVVERPASIIKEVLENALDANAKSLVIDIEKGGLTLCRVRDDGDGIVKDQLLLAVAPHATGKIADVNDLIKLHSMGFRGEALASISSVSRFKLISKPENQELAAQLSIGISSSDEAVITSAAHPKGTTIECRDLFYNVPVRRTFLKSAKTESVHIEAVVKKIALSKFDLSIELNHNGKKIFNLPAAKSEIEIEKRISRLLGKEFFNSSKYFEQENGDFKISGWLSSPDYLRSQSDLQYVFLNGRMVRDKLLMHAIRQVYEPYLYPGRAACFLLYFELPSEDVDVNVHPTKHEVRFKDSRSVHNFIISALTPLVAPPIETIEEMEKTQEQSYSLEIEPSEVIKDKKTLTQLATTAVNTHLDLNIIALDQAHALFIHDSKTYLFNVSELYKQMLLSRIKKTISEQAKLANRPVLVPVMVNLTAQQINNFPFELAIKYGFDINRLSNETIAVRAFPVMTPHIDLKSCLEAMANKPGDIENIIADNQLLCLAQLNKDEQSALLRFLIDYDKQKQPILAYKCLTQQNWQEILAK